jgi:hypothetical protein
MLLPLPSCARDVGQEAMHGCHGGDLMDYSIYNDALNTAFLLFRASLVTGDLAVCAGIVATYRLGM